MSDLLPWFAPWSGRALVLVAALVGLAIVALSYRRRRASVDPCRRCSYELAGTTGDRCPECGHLRGARSWRPLLPRRRWVFLLGVACIVALPAFVAHRRMREFGWTYYMRLEPLYSLDPFETVTTMRTNGVTAWSERDRRTSIAGEHVWLKDGDGAVQLLGPNGTLSTEYVRAAELTIARVTAEDVALVVSAFSGGAHCCTVTYVFRIDDGRAALAATIETGNASLVVHDVDGDDIDELDFADDCFAYWRAPYALSPKMRLVGRLSPDGLTLAEDLQRREVPAAADREAALRVAFGSAPAPAVPVEVWALALDWIYAGHGTEALESLARAWPADRGDREAFLNEFLEQLATSRWAEDLARINAGPLSDRLRPASRPDSTPTRG